MWPDALMGSSPVEIRGLVQLGLKPFHFQKAIKSLIVNMFFHFLIHSVLPLHILAPRICVFIFREFLHPPETGSF